MPFLCPSISSHSSLFLLPYHRHSVAQPSPFFSILLLRPFSSSPQPSATATTNTTTATTRVGDYFRRARLIDSLRIRLRSPDPSPLPCPLDPSLASAALRSAPSPASALAVFRSLPHPPHPHLLLSLARRLALARLLPDLRSLLDASPSAFSPLDRLRLLAAAGDRPASLLAFSSLRSSPRLRHGHPCTESYNLVLALHAAAGDHRAAVSTFAQMVRDGAIPNSRTYTVAIEHLARSGHLDPAVEVFRLLPLMRVRRTSKQYSVLAEAFSSAGRFGDLRWLIQEMGSDGILPGRPVLAAIARMRAAGHTGGTEEFAQELRPNEQIGDAVDLGEEGGSEEELDDGDGDGGEPIRLKPWLDPTALARALEGWDPVEVAELEAAELVWTPRLVCKLLRAFRKPETAWEFFCWVAYQPGGFTHDRHTVARMVAILARRGHVELVDRLLAKVKAEGILLPFATLRLVVDFYGLSKKADAAIRVFREAEAICGPLTAPNRMLLCSSLLRTVVKCRKGDVAMELLEEMMLEGVLPDIQTFTGLMQYFAEAGDLRTVYKLFGTVRQCGLEPDAYMCRVLIRAYCKQERAALALRVFEEMRSSGMAPDAATKALLVRSLWKEGKLREAASAEERCEEEAGEGLPAASPGHVWTVSARDFKRVYDIYSGCFAETSG